MKGICCKPCLFFACFVLFFMIKPATASFIDLDPDNYATGTAIPSNTGTLMRTWSQNVTMIDNVGYFTDYWARQNFLSHRAYSVEPLAGSGLNPSTYSKVYGYNSSSGSSLLDGNTMHVIFGAYDSSQGTFGRVVYQPTNFASIDALWPGDYGGHPSPYVDLRVYGANNTLLSTHRYNNSGVGTFSDLSVFDTNIHRISITPSSSWNYDNYGLDNLYFMDSSSAGTLFNLSDSPNIVATNGIILENHDTLTGNGSISGDLINSGTLSPGKSPGTIEILGDYEQLIDGILNMEIGGLNQGTEYDWLNVSGLATLGGALDVSLFDFGTGAFDLSADDSFDILSATTIFSEFDYINLPSLRDQLDWSVDYIHNEETADVVRLSILDTGNGTPIPEPVPEPSTFILFAGGMIGLAWYRRTR